MRTAAVPPPPPPGPGVFPPFPAPPIEGRGRRIGIGLGIGGVVLVLACGGGIAGFTALISLSDRAVNEEAHVVIGEYFDDVRAKRYDEAYREQCQEAKDAESEAEFIRRIGQEQPIASYTVVGKVGLTSIDRPVPVNVTYVSGDTDQLFVDLGEDQQSNHFQVCGVEE